MGYVPDAVITRLRGSGNWGIYFQLLTVPRLRLWSGPSNINQTMPGIDTTGPELYRGVRLNEEQLGQFDIMLNGGAERGTFTLEGVSQDSIDKISGIDPEVKGARVYLGLASHGDDWQPLSDIIRFQSGRADFWSMEQPVSGGEGAATRTLKLAVALGETGRSRPRRVAYTNPQQQLIYPGDTFCQDVTRYHRGYICTWPRF